MMEAVRKRVLPYFATGALKSVIDSVFPLAEVASAHDRMQQRLHCGKILLEVATHSE
jgi:NADPH:quinone reductase-like Zn-dependent oxidoreductase